MPQGALFTFPDIKHLLLVDGDRWRIRGLSLTPSEKEYVEAIIMCIRLQDSSFNESDRQQVIAYLSSTASRIAPNKQRRIINLIQTLFPYSNIYSSFRAQLEIIN